MANCSNFPEDLWRRIGHSVFIDIDLEAISNNIKILKRQVDNGETGKRWSTVYIRGLLIK